MQPRHTSGPMKGKFISAAELAQIEYAEKVRSNLFDVAWNAAQESRTEGGNHAKGPCPAPQMERHAIDPAEVAAGFHAEKNRNKVAYKPPGALRRSVTRTVWRLNIEVWQAIAAFYVPFLAVWGLVLGGLSVWRALPWLRHIHNLIRSWY